MKAEEMVVDDPLDQVERAPAGERGAEQLAAGGP
jgi:hypothetical protein